MCDRDSKVWKGHSKKTICNNLEFRFDKEENQKFNRYEMKGGQHHDAGYDAYMTGIVFARTAKYIEIGQLILNSK